MEALVVTFKADATEEEFTAANEAGAQAFGEVQGLLAKVWITDPDTGTYGGIKFFEDGAALESYMESGLFRGILEDPALRDHQVRRFHVIEKLTAKTQPGIEVTRAVPA